MSIYQHFRPEEKDFIDQVQHWRREVENKYVPKLTDFLDPREQRIVQMLIGQHQDVRCEFMGGTEQAERKRALLFPDYYEMEAEDFQLALLELDYPRRFITIEHPQVLGSMMSLGVQRGKFGDILMNDDHVQLVVAKEIETYVKLHLESIGKAKVSLASVPLETIIQVEENWNEQSTTASSLRLDAIIAAIYRFSRQKAQLHINQGLVKVNFTKIENPSFICEEGDVFSVRGEGRAMIRSIEGKTKKDKWRLLFGKLK